MFWIIRCDYDNEYSIGNLSFTETKWDKKGLPWFLDGSEFAGDWVNDVHLTNDQEQKMKGYQ